MQFPRFSIANLDSAHLGKDSEICPQEILVQLIRGSHMKNSFLNFLVCGMWKLDKLWGILQLESSRILSSAVKYKHKVVTFLLLLFFS